MNSIKCLVAALTFGWVFGGLQAASVKEIKTTTHYPWNGGVDVSYTVSGVEDGSECDLSAIVHVGGKDYAALTTTITEDGEYSFLWDAAKVGFVGRVEDAKVIFTVAEPNFAIVDLSAGPTATNYPVAYRMTVSDATDDIYKTTKLLLKRLGTKYVGVYETTQKQYELVMGVAQTDAVNKQAYFSLYEDKGVEAKRPIERISYEALVENGGFFDRLVTRSGLPFALPTGEEWEAAARGKMPANKDFNLGPNNYEVITGKAQDNTWLPNMGRYIDLWADGKKIVNGNNNPNRYTDANKGTAIVGSYAANDNGLYDMHGNVAEWTAEESGAGSHVLRGGSWRDSVADCAIGAKRASADVDASQVNLAGFRVFGDAEKIDEGFVHGTTAESNPFAIDVATETRQIRVEDNDGTYTFFYTPEGWEDEREWVDVTNAVGTADWKPDHHGVNTATNAADETVTAKFDVEALEFGEKDIVATGYEGVYDGGEHTGSVKTSVKNTTIKYGETEGVYTLTKLPMYKDADTYTVYYEVSNAFYWTVTGSFTVKITPLTIAEAKIKLTPDTLIYNSKEQVKEVSKVTVQGLPLTADDYEVEVSKHTDATYAKGEEETGYKLTITGKGNYKDEKTVDWGIRKAQIDGQMMISPGSFVYDGAEKKPAITNVTAENGTLTLTTDEYLDQTKGEKVVGNYTAKVVSDSKNFEGTAEAQWTIEQRSIDSVKITIADLTYTGAIQTPTITVTDESGKIEKSDYDYKIEPSEVKLAGDYKAIFTAKGNYKGTKEVPFKVNKATLQSMTLNKETLTYNGKEQEVTVTSVTTANGVTVPTVEYDVDGVTGTDAMNYTAKVTLNAKGSANFTGGPLTKAWTIAPLDLSEPNVVELIPDPSSYGYVYDGMPKTAVVEKVAIKHPDGMMITNDCKVGFTLENDYIRTNFGKYSVRVVGKDNITGKREADWEIKESTENIKVELSANEFVYNGGEQKPEVTVTDSSRKDTQTLTEGVDYDITWPQDMTNASEKLTIEIVGKEDGNYPSLSKTADYKILKAGIETLTLNTTSFDFDNTEKSVQVDAVMTTNGVKVTDADYDFTGDTTGTAAKTYTAKVTAKAASRNFHGSAEATWTITQRSIDNVTITISGLTYNREVQTPLITVEDAGKITAGDYTYEIKPSEVKLAGDYSVTFTAKGNYTGKTNVSFKVNKAVVDTLTLDGETEMTYTGGECTVDGRAFAGNLELLPDEWQITGNVGTNAGPYTAGVKLVDTVNFDLASPAPTAPWEIKPLNIGAAATTVVLDPATYAKEYDGTPKQVVKDDVDYVKANDLEVGDYTVTCEPQTTNGIYTFTVNAGGNNFTGSTNWIWSIVPRSITNATITLTTNLVWNGVTVITNNGTKLVRTILTNATEQTMTFDVFDGVRPLTNGVHYVIDSVNTNVGTKARKYLLQLNGIGNYASSISTNWVIAPSLVTITPNVENPGTNEVVYAEKGVQRVQMERDDGDWTLWMRRTCFDGEGKETTSYVNPFRSFVVGQRTRVDGWAVTADGVTGSVRTVDFRIGHAAEPFAVLADADNIPYLYEDGTAWTNSVGAVITNFCHNGQLVYLTRGNLAVSNDVAGARILFTNSTDQAYTNGVLRYTIDGSEPTVKSPAWTAESRIAITNTTTVLSKVFGGQIIDSPVVTNVFVRERNKFAAPTISFKTNDWETAASKVFISTMPYQIKVERNDADTTFGKLVYSFDGGATTNDYVDVITTNASVMVMAWVEDVNYELEPSDTVTSEFICDPQLATPWSEFSTNNPALKQYQSGATTFKNAKQVIDLKRKDTGLTKDTDGVLRVSLDEGTTWMTNVLQVTIWGTTNVWVQAVASKHGLADSEICKDLYTQEPESVNDPCISINGTPTVKQMEIIIDSDPGTTVYYTLDGTTPIGINESGKTSAKYTGTVIYDIDVNEKLVVKAIAYKEDGAGDFFGRSAVAEKNFTRAWTIGDSIKPDAPEKQAKPDQPDASDRAFDNTDNAEYDNTNTAWVVDETYFVATNAQGKGSSMRSGAARSGDPSEKTSYSTLRTTVRGPGTITFKWASSTEFDEYDPSQKFDVGTFYVDGEVVAEISGTNDWKDVTFTITEDGAAATDHELTWQYAKDWMDDDYIFEKYDIQDCIWVDDFVWTCVPDMKQMSIKQNPLTYNKDSRSPTFVVTLTNEQGVVVATLEEGEDYTIEATAKTAAGEYDYTLHATGTNYTGSVSGKWMIGQLSITNAVVTLSANPTYNQENQSVTVESIKVGELELTNVVSWTATGTNAKEVGEYWAVITGADNLTGVASNKWFITPKAITADMITVPTDIVYFGGETNVTANSDTFKVAWKGEDIVCTYTGNIATNAGTYTVTVKAVENETLKDYTGTASKEWTIAQFDFDQYGSLLVLTNETFVYNGYEQTNEVDYVLGMHPVFGAVAFSNEAWWVSNNVATTVGTYWTYLYPSNESNFAGGPISNRWEIVPYDKEVDVAFGPWPVYDGGATELSPTITSVTTVPGGLTLVEGRDYTVEYASKDLQNRKYALKGTLTIVGKGNFYGLRKENVAFEILPEQIENTTIDLADWSYVYDGTEKVPGIKMTLPNGKPVKMDQSPQKDGKKIGGWMILDGSMTNGTNAGSYPINIKGYYDYTETADTPYTGNIAGETNVTWKIEQLNLTDPSVTITLSAESFVYNRQVQQPAVTVTCNGKTIPADDIVLDFTDVDCSNACDAITFKVKGSGVNVTNEVEKSYKITPAQITGIKFVAQPGKPWVCTYDGKAHSPKVAEVSAEGGLTLTVDEYELTDVGKVDVGEYTSAVTSKSRNFSDPAMLPSAKWKITPKSIEGAEVVVTFGRPLVYNGQPQMIDDVKDITVTVGDLTVDGVKFDCPEHADAGSYDDAVVTATGKNFTGSHTVQWTIEQRDITDAAIVWENARLLWNGQEGVPAKEQTPVIKAITVGGPDLEAGETIEFKGTAAVLTVDDGNKTEAGRYASTVTGTKNFKGTTTQAQTWEIVPKAPLITPNDGTGKYTRLADYVTVEINNNTSNQLWSIYYTTNGWAETKTYPVKGGKWDIEGHTVVEAYAVSCDGFVTGETARCEYFFGKRNVAPTIGLTALDGAEADRPSPWPKDNTEVKGAAKLIVTDNDNVHTNFFHGKTKVYLTRFGAMTQAEIDQTIKDSTTDKDLCPYLDGEIWYTVATDGTEIVAPTNATGFGSTLFETNNPASWPTISTNAVIVARVFGKELESSAEVTNVFQRLWTTMPKPDMTADATFHLSQTVEITTNDYAGADWTVTNANQKIYITVNGGTEFLYTNAFELTWKDCDENGKAVVTAVSEYGDDYIDSDKVTRTYTHEKKQFLEPTLTESTEFRHAQPDGFKVSLTNNAPLGVGGILTYSVNGSDPIPCGDDSMPKFDFSVYATTTVRVWVAANDAAHDYYTSETNEAIYTYSPYKMVAPTFDQDSQTFYDMDFEYTVNYPTRGVAEDADHIYDGGVISYSTDDGKNWTAIAKTDLPKTFKTSETVTVMVKQTLEDHLDSDVVTRTFTRDVKAPTIELVNEDGTPAYVETPAGATNYFHKAFVAMSCDGGDTHVEYTIVEDGQPEKRGTYTDKLPVADTFTVTAWSVTTGGSKSTSVTATYTRQWETLVQPKITLIDPSGESGDEFWYTGDRIAITNDETAVAEHTAVLWPTNFTVKYAVYTNSNDTTTVPTGWATFVQGVTTNFFKADTNAVWAIVEADDYLPSTNAVSFIRQLSYIGEFTEDMVHFDSPETRYEVNVTFDTPFAASTIYYTYEITNDEAGVSTPWGNEYDVTKSSARYEGAFKVAIKPRQTLIVKARAYWEDESSALVGVAETNFVSRGEVVVGKYTLPWTIADALDFPDPENPFTVSDSIAKKGNTNCVEDTANYSWEGAGSSLTSMVFTNLVDNETVTLETMVMGPGTVTFDWRTSCEQGGHGYNHDYLAFSVDGTEVARLDGESGWTNVTFKIDGAGDDIHFLQWSYKKDAAEKKGSDCAWVDHFTWMGELQASDITKDMHEWFELYEPYPGYYATMLADGNLTNWKEALAMDSAVTGRSYWDCYVLGLDPDDWETDFVAGAPDVKYAEDTEGKTVPKSVTITWTPCTKAGRTYTLVGKKTLIDADWTILATLNATKNSEKESDCSIKASLLNEANKDYQFFQLRVRMTK